MQISLFGGNKNKTGGKTVETMATDCLQLKKNDGYVAVEGGLVK